jgi:uncharacterized phiE125 gp8 family phage protein
MTPTLLEGPASEPVSLADMKSWLRLSASDEDSLIAALITAARLTVEAACGCELIAQRWRVALDHWPRDGLVRLPLKPVIACEAARVFTSETTSVALPSALYRLDAHAAPARFILLGAAIQPGRSASGIEIDLQVGFGADASAVPRGLRLAVKMLAARWFERRGDDPGEMRQPPLPPDVVALLAPWRDARI